MARTINDIKTIITSTYVAEMANAGVTVDPTTWSVVNLQRLIIYIFSVCQFVLENLFDVFKSEVNTTIKNLKPGTKSWYKTMVLNFQYGYDLPVDSDTYDNTGLTQAEIDDSKIVKYVAVTDRGEIVTIKVAKLSGTDLVPLSSGELAALQAYVAKIKYGGVFISIINEPADSLKLNITINYLPMILDSNGINISSGFETVKIAIDTYLKNIDFDGQFAPQDLVDALQKVEGVNYATPSLVQVKADAGASYENVEVYYNPAAGYLRFINPTHLNITYVPYAN